MRHDYKGSIQEKMKAELGNDPLVAYLRNASSEDINLWCGENVQTLAQVKDVLQRVIKILSLLYSR